MERPTRISAGIIGMGVGLILGVVWMWLGFGAALLAGALALLGWFVGWIVESISSGRLQPGELWASLQGRRAA